MKKIYLLVIALLMVFALFSCQRKAMKPTSLFDALPAGIKLDHVVSYGKKEATVQEKPVELKACSKDGKLFDGNHREIRFYRLACFGNPPHDYDEIRQREQAEIEQLRQNFTVIAMECNPLIM